MKKTRQQMLVKEDCRDSLANCNGTSREVHWTRVNDSCKQASADAKRFLGGMMKNQNKVVALRAPDDPKSSTGVRRTAKFLTTQEDVESARSAQLAAETIQADLRDDAAFRERLIGVIGHDLRNPLNAISMAASLLATSENITTSDLQLATRIVESARRMNTLIAQVLDFTRVRLGGGFPLSPSTIDLSEICNQVVAELRLAALAQIDVNVVGNVTGEWDMSLLGAMISNLAANAVDHSWPSTSVSINLHEASFDVVVIEIRNQGDTIPHEAIPTLFDPFKRADSLARPRDHLGLGLYIVHEIVRSHRGTINVSSANNETCFSVQLPRVREA